MDFAFGVAAGVVIGFALCKWLWPSVVERERIVVHDINEIDAEIRTKAKQLVTDVENKFATESDEFKRSQVYRALQNIFPSAIKRDLAFAIELALR